MMNTNMPQVSSGLQFNLSSSDSSPDSIMQHLIHNKPFARSPPQLLTRNFLWKSYGFLRIHTQKCDRNCATLTLRTFASTQSLSYGGWDDFRFSSDSGESNQLHNFLNFLGIGDKKYAFVYLFGFVCALAVSRIRVSSIVVFPACAFVFALGFSAGLVKRGEQSKELRLNVNRKKFIDDSLKDSNSIEKMRNLKDNLREYNEKVVNLKDDITRGIECNEITVSDLEGYVDVIESTSSAFQKAMDEVESCIHNVLVHSQGKDGSLEHKSGRRRKKFGENGFNLPQYFEGLFRGNFNGSKRDKIKLVDVEAKDRKLDNIVMLPVQDRNVSPAASGNVGSKSTVRAQNRAINYMDGIGVGDTALENEKENVTETNNFAGSVFDQTTFSYQNKASRVVNNWHFEDDMDMESPHDDPYDSVDFRISMDNAKAAASFEKRQKRKSLNRNYTQFESTEEDQCVSQKFSYKREGINSRKRPSFNRPLAQDNSFSSSPSLLDDDLEFSRYLVESNNLLKEAKGCLSQQVDNVSAEHSLHKSAILLSKAIDMRPTSLLAVGQLGNTYLLHGELKLRMSRELRSQIVRVKSSSFEKMKRAHNRFDDRLGNQDKIVPVLTNLCEECEELLIKAGKTYKMALSIDGNDIRSLYNWGLALSLRAQLIADIGPTVAHDADKVFLAAIEKFDAMMSKSNDCAPNALFRWGAALQHRSRLRPSHSREKVKLLQQARQLYEDALNMDSENIQLQEALSSCTSEMDHQMLLASTTRQ